MPRTAALLDGYIPVYSTRTSPVFDGVFVPHVLVVHLELWADLVIRGWDGDMRLDRDGGATHRHAGC